MLFIQRRTAGDAWTEDGFAGLDVRPFGKGLAGVAPFAKESTPNNRRHRKHQLATFPVCQI